MSRQPLNCRPVLPGVLHFSIDITSVNFGRICFRRVIIIYLYQKETCMYNENICLLATPPGSTEQHNHSWHLGQIRLQISDCVLQLIPITNARPYKVSEVYFIKCLSFVSCIFNSPTPTPAFVTYGALTTSGKCWGEKAWVRGYMIVH